MSELESWTVLVQLCGLHRALSPVLHGDILLSINEDEDDNK